MQRHVGPGRVCVLYTGGTIGMRSTAPDLHSDEPPMYDPAEIEHVLRERTDLPVDFQFRPLLGQGDGGFRPVVSSQILPEHWALIARTIHRYYDDYAGFVVLHGTDTMAWTASALSFMFGNLSKPIVLTGSQRPLSDAPSDAVSNFENAVMVAGRGRETIPRIPEVVVCFGDVVLRGNRTTKVSAASLQGFETPNAPRLGRVGRHIDVDHEQVRAAPARDDGCFLRLGLEPRIADVVLHPGMTAAQVERALEGCAGAVLRTFGAGNAPGGRAVEAVLRAAVVRGAVLVNVTQADEGTVEAGMLSGSRALADCGVVSGLDLTSEAAFTKLMVLLGNETPAVAREQMQLDQRGEQSLDLVELHATCAPAGPDGASRTVLTPALHARARPDRLRSAVLRLRSRDGAGPSSRPTQVTVHVNHWGAGAATQGDVRSTGPHRVVTAPGTERPRDVVVDLTDLARIVLEPGAPVTVTLVPADGALDVDVVLSLFVDRDTALSAAGRRV